MPVAPDDLEAAVAAADELRELSRDPSASAEVRERYAKALVSAQWRTREAGDETRADAFLDELRMMAEKDEASQVFLAYGLRGAFHLAHQNAALARAETLHDELKALASRNPDSKEIRSAIADTLVSQYIFAEGEDAIEDAAYRSAARSWSGVRSYWRKAPSRVARPPAARSQPRQEDAYPRSLELGYALSPPAGRA